MEGRNNSVGVGFSGAGGPVPGPVTELVLVPKTAYAVPRSVDC